MIHSYFAHGACFKDSCLKFYHLVSLIALLNERDLCRSNFSFNSLDAWKMYVSTTRFLSILVRLPRTSSCNARRALSILCHWLFICWCLQPKLMSFENLALLSGVKTRSRLASTVHRCNEKVEVGFDLLVT